MHDPPNGSDPSGLDPRTLALESLNAQVDHLRLELAHARGTVDDRDRLVAELRDVIATRDAQIQQKDEELLVRERHIRHLTRWRRIVPSPIQSAIRGRGRR
jgi:chromosome segregation ATPase